jgi:hypothetical protein
VATADGADFDALLRRFDGRAEHAASLITKSSAHARPGTLPNFGAPLGLDSSRTEVTPRQAARQALDPVAVRSEIRDGVTPIALAIARAAAQYP